MQDTPALSRLPAVGSLLETPRGRSLAQEYGHVPLAEALRDAIGELRQRLLHGDPIGPRAEEAALEIAAEALRIAARPSLRPVINATGVIVHTNLGRSVLAEEAARAVYEICRSYSNLEADLDDGKRSSRHVHIEDRVRKVIGAEAGAVFNNNAAAVMLALAALARGKEVIISRGQLVEIGGSFRIPEVIEQSGCVLREVGATNRTHLRDYERAIGDETAAILVAHPSNYRIIGFTSAPRISELAELAHSRGLVLIEDLGSGALVDLEPFGVGPEPRPQESLAQGADLVTFSGDKLLGGPQCGIAVGRGDLIEKMKKHPLARAVRVGKMTLAALAATLDLLADPQRALERIPTLRAATEPMPSVRARADELASQLREGLPPGWVVEVREDRSARVGGGALPEQELPTACARVTPPMGRSVDEAAQRLRTGEPAVYPRIEDGAVVLDARTVFPSQVVQLVGAFSAVATDEMYESHE